MNQFLTENSQNVAYLPRRNKAKQPSLEGLEGKADMLTRLEESLSLLVKSINRLGYTRNAKALASAAGRCQEVERLVRECSVICANGSNPVVDQLLLVQAHQLLAQARDLLYAPLEPVSRDGNIVELRPNYRELTDAAFERLLVESDIPQLLSSKSRVPVDGAIDAGRRAIQTKRVHLTLAYSRD